MRILLFLLLSFSVVSFGQANLIPIDSAGYVKLIDPSGNNITPFKKLQSVRISYFDQLIYAKKNNLFGVVDNKLEFVIPPKYVSIYRRKNFIVAEQLTKLDIFSLTGEKLFSVDDFTRIEFDESFADRSRFVSRESVSGKLNNMIVETFDGVGILHENLQWLIKPGELSQAFCYNYSILTRKGNKYGAILGDTVEIPATFSSVSYFNHSILEFSDETGQRHYFSRAGKKYPLSDSTLVETGSGSETYKIYRNGKAELYDYKAERVFPFLYDDIFEIGYEQDANWSFQNPVGKRIYAVKIGNKIGAVNELNEQILPFSYEYVAYHKKDRFVVIKDSLFGVIDGSNNWVIEPNFTFLTAVKDSYKVYNEDTIGVMNIDGDTIVPIAFKELRIFHYGIVTVDKGKFGYYNNDGEQVLKTEWNRPRVKSHGYSFLEFSNGTETCLVAKKRLTFGNPQKMTYDYGHLKYYTPNYIVICQLQEGEIVDSVIYPLAKSINLRKQEPRENVSTDDPDFTEFLCQLNGKYGSKRKTGKGYAIEPIFCNLFNYAGYHIGKWRVQTTIPFANKTMSGKEALQPLYGSSGQLGIYHKAYTYKRDYKNWHSTALDPIVTSENEYQFYSQNDLYVGTAPYISKIRGARLAVLLSGEVNMEEGTGIWTVRDFFEHHNSHYNLTIQSKAEFDLLTKNDSVRVKNPNWYVMRTKRSSPLLKIGTFNDYVEYSSGFARFKIDGEGYMLYSSGDTAVVQDAGQIIPITYDELMFYKVYERVEHRNGTTEYFWNLYNALGPMFKKRYSEIEVITSSYFRVEKEQTWFIIDKDENILYTYPR